VLVAALASLWIASAASAATPAGALAPRGCVFDPDGGSQHGLPESVELQCAAALALDGAYSAAMSPDGRHLYVGSFNGDSLTTFVRNRTSGVLGQPGATQDACIVLVRITSPCASGDALYGPSSVVTSPDGRHVYVSAFFGSGVVAFARETASGRLTQVGCLSLGVEFEDDGCAFGRALYGPGGMAISPDGRHVYVAATGEGAIVVLARNRATGELLSLAHQDACIHSVQIDDEGQAGVPADCRAGVAIAAPTAVAVSPDGKNVYAASFGSNALSVFARDASTGRLRQVTGRGACVSEDGTAGLYGQPGNCTDGRNLTGAFGVTVSPDGKNVYLATGFDIRHNDFDPFATSGVAIFARNATTGRLRQLPGRTGCVSQSGSAGLCTDGRALEGAQSLTVSADGRNVYVAGAANDAIAIFARDAAGRLRQLAGREGCVSEGGSQGCRQATGLDGVSAIAVPRDGRHVYAPSYFSSAVAMFSRTPAPRRAGR
jgi:DNA-binding beta-propeller fold protein YncE